MTLVSLFNMTPTWFLVGVLSAVSVLWLWSSRKRSFRESNVPPFPVDPWPIFGHMLMMLRFREKIQVWRREAGDIYSIHLGGKLNICVHSFEVIKEIMNKHSDCIVNTAHNFNSGALKEENKGIISARGDNWREQRSTSLSILRAFGMGKNIMAIKIQEEVSFAIEKMRVLRGEPTDLSGLLRSCIENIICSIAIGHRFKHEDPHLIHILETARSVTKYAAPTNMENALKLLSYMPGDLFHIKKWTKAAKDATEFTKTFIKDLIKSSYENNEPENFVAAYLQEIRKMKEKAVETHLSEENLVAIVRFLLIAGTDSTSGTILWCLLYILYNPHVQEKIYSEIEANITASRLPAMADKPCLTYVNAVIMETQRMASLTPVGTMREISKPFQVSGFTFPDGSILWPVLDSVHNDKKIWGDPENFRPERFIDEKGALINREELIPFGIGKRVCLGESLVKMELFLFLSAMFQNFQFEPADDSGQLPTLKSNTGAVFLPHAFKIKAVPRN